MEEDQNKNEEKLQTQAPPAQSSPSPPKEEPKEELEGEVISSSNEPEFEEREGLAGKLEEFLQEIHLQPRHIFYGIGCIIGIVLLIYAALFGFKWLKNRKSQEVPPTKPPTEISAEETGLPQITAIGKIFIVSEAIVGETGLFAAEVFGANAIPDAPIAQYVMNFRKLQNAYEADIIELLNKATDRRARFKSHTTLLKNLFTGSTEILKRIQEETAVIEAAYEIPRQRQEDADINFFEQLNALNPETSSQLLNEFISSSREVVRLRAQFKALGRIGGFYEEALPKVERRIKDMELNEEALVAGLKVYDVKGSDLKLILPVNGGGVSGETAAPMTEPDRLSSPAIPFLPVHPSKVNVGKDFITQPGGGF